jgi:hypothetical protein
MSSSPVRIVDLIGAVASIQQIHHELVIHSPGRRDDSYRFCLPDAAPAGGLFSSVQSARGVYGRAWGA